MKKYLYIILSACVMFTACDLIDLNFGTTNGGNNSTDDGNDDGNDDEGNEIPQYDVEFYFSDIEVTTTEDSATIKTIRPYMTVDGETLKTAQVYLEYCEAESEELTTVESYVVTSGDAITFTLEGLSAETLYLAYLYVDGGSDYGSDSQYFAFRTAAEEVAPTYAISCNSSVDAYGLKAAVRLTDVDYLANGESVAIDMLRLEYAKEGSNKWTAIDVDGKALADREEVVTIPAEGDDYLVENTTYRYTITITPKDESLAALSTPERSFTTTYAEVVADIATPELTLYAASLHIEIASVDIYCDGIYYPTYPHYEYYIYMREKGHEGWTPFTISTSTNSMALNINRDSLTPGMSYEVVGAVIAGLNSQESYSEVATIEIPNDEEEPTPQPPVGGDTDTTAIAGEWQLTTWRGATPSFDVYLSISEDGVVGLWQRLASREWEMYYSTVIYEDNTIWGEYTDGTAWGASYYVTISGDTMTWVDTADSTDISIYTRTEIPDDVTQAKRSSHTGASSPRFL
ncbi:MAG: hypothetical protein IJX40_03375 [Alistipes sp.]|nr:hypothetical protein [Alistipes sp.]